DPADPIRGEAYSNTHYDVSVCWSRIPDWAGHADARHCIRHGDVRLDDPDFVLIGDESTGDAVRQFSRGDRGYHRQVRRHGPYLEKHNWGERKPRRTWCSTATTTTPTGGRSPRTSLSSPRSGRDESDLVDGPRTGAGRHPHPGRPRRQVAPRGRPL